MGIPPSTSTTWLGLPGQSYFKHHRWLLHLSKHRMEQQMPHHNTAQQYHWGQSWEAHRTCRRATKKRPTGGVQGMGFTGETEQCLPAQRHKYWYWDRKTRVTSSFCPLQALTHPHAGPLLVTRPDICLLQALSPRHTHSRIAPSRLRLSYLTAGILFPVLIFLVWLVGLEGLTCWKTAIASPSAALTTAQWKTALGHF